VLDIERIIGVDKWLAVPYNVQTDRENQQVTYDEKGLSTMAKQEMNQKSIPVRPSELVDVVEHVMSVGRPCMIWGPPGIGKSDIIAQIGNRENRPVIDLRLLLMEPTDLKGIPFYDPKTETMKWGKPGELPGEADTELHNAILFLDEINAAPQSVQAAAYQLILNRRVGEYELPEGVSIVAAGNRETDRAVTFRMPSALANRFMHFELIVSFEDWQDWAIRNGVNSDVIGFLTAHPNYLFQFDPKSGDKAFATPRSWTFVGEALTDKLSDKLNEVMVAGTVGLGLATEFMTSRRLKGKLPNPRDIVLGKVTTLKDDKAIDVSAKYSLVIGMCYAMSEIKQEFEMDKTKGEKDWNKVTDNFLKFMMVETHFKKEMVIMAAVTAFRRYDLDFDSETATFNKFFKEYQEWIV
jgi:hypothetical protein